MSLPSYFWKVNGVVMPTPDSCPITEYDLDSGDTGRPESGVLHRERVRSNVGNYDMAFTKLSVEEAETIREAIAPASIEVQVWFLGRYVTRTMYAGDRSFELVITSDGKQYYNLTFTLSEY